MARAAAATVLATLCLALGAPQTRAGKVFGISTTYNQAGTIDVASGKYEFVGKPHFGSLVTPGLAALGGGGDTFLTYTNEDNLATNNVLGFSTKDGTIGLNVVIPSLIEPYGGKGVYLGYNPKTDIVFVCALPADFMDPNITMWTVNTRSKALTKVGTVGPKVPVNGFYQVSAMDYGKNLFWLQGYYNILFSVDQEGNQEYHVKADVSLVSLDYYHGDGYMYGLSNAQGGGVVLASFSSRHRKFKQLATFPGLKSVHTGAATIDAKNGILYALAFPKEPLSGSVDSVLVGIDLKTHKIVSNVEACHTKYSRTVPCPVGLVYLD